jgi:formylglycine-generating enzyme required for sulfatase activity
MSRKLTIPCDRCGARLDNIPEKCPHCGEIIRDRMDPYMRERIEYFLQKGKWKRHIPLVLSYLFFMLYAASLWFVYYYFNRYNLFTVISIVVFGILALIYYVTAWKVLRNKSRYHIFAHGVLFFLSVAAADNPCIKRFDYVMFIIMLAVTAGLFCIVIFKLWMNHNATNEFNKRIWALKWIIITLILIPLLIFATDIWFVIQEFRLMHTDSRWARIDIAWYLLELDEANIVSNCYTKRYASRDVKERLAFVDELCAFEDKGKELMQKIFRNRCKREMVLIPAGVYMMGSENGYPDEKPVHKVTLDAFWMDKYEVTNEKYYVFVKCTNRAQPGRWQYGSILVGWELNPVEDVSWEDAHAYARWLGMRLPTEAEWEYACRAGSTTEYCFGDNVFELGDYAWFYNNSDLCRAGSTTEYCFGDNVFELGNYAWFYNNSDLPWHPVGTVGTKKPNKWGLFDMHGNTTEWCQDWYNEKYYSTSPTVDPKGPRSGRDRVLRGGDQSDLARYCRSAHRSRRYPEYRSACIVGGFRVCHYSSQ